LRQKQMDSNPNAEAAGGDMSAKEKAF